MGWLGDGSHRGQGCSNLRCVHGVWRLIIGDEGTAVAAPLPFRLGNPALCGSHPLVTQYYCRQGDLLCFVFMSVYCMFDLSVYYLFLQYFGTVGWVFWPIKTVSHCVGMHVKHCSIQSDLVDGSHCRHHITSVTQILSIRHPVHC